MSRSRSASLAARTSTWLHSISVRSARLARTRRLSASLSAVMSRETPKIPTTRPSASRSGPFVARKVAGPRGVDSNSSKVATRPLATTWASLARMSAASAGAKRAVSSRPTTASGGCPVWRPAAPLKSR